MKNISTILAVTCAAAAMLTACGDSNKWTLRGNITEPAPDGYVVEAYDNGRWYLLDSLKLNFSGEFSYSHEAMGYPDVYRVRSGEQSVYFPIDSIETVSLSASGADFASKAVISGSAQADAMMRVDSIINASLAANGNAAYTDEATKRRLASVILTDPSSIIAYYVINRRIGGQPLFNPASKADLRVIGAVANAYSERRPSDPRTAYLRSLYLDSRRAISPRDNANTVIANEISAPEINLYDNNGKRQSLNVIAGKGNVVLLNVTAYDAQESPAFNVMLNKLYERYHGAGLEIYQVAMDTDEYLWKQTADNLPWITVINDAAEPDRVLRDYNIGSVPAIFILDRQGNVAERVTDLNQLDALVAKYM